MKSLIQKLVEVASPSGYEKPVRDLIRAEVEPYADHIRVDTMGNLIATRGTVQEGGLKVMIAGHMDEIGVVVSHIDERGFLRIQPIGGVRPGSCLGGRVRFLDGRSGMIFSERLDDPNRMPAFENLYIDVGATSRENSGVRVGDIAVFDRPFVDLGDRLLAKAFDDRIGCAIMIEAMRRMAEEKISSPHQIFFVFTTQEEVGTRGATTSAYEIDPDLGLSVDVTPAGDTPKGWRVDTQLGKGPAIKVRDGGMLADPRVVEWMVRTAEKAGIPYQMEVLEMGSTDARAIQLARAGVPAGCLSIPNRYTHSPSEICDYNDVQNSVRLMVELLRAPIEL